jgi:iron complex transport system substrate-binding protein
MSRSSLILVALGLVLHQASAEAPQRIISTSPGVTEILFALGLGERVVGVTQYCSWPPEVARIPKIGTWTTPNMEAIVAARPDLIVVQRTAVHTTGRFEALTLRTLDVNLDRIPDIYETIDKIGTAAGVPARATALNASIRRGLSEIRDRVAPRPPTPVMFVVGRNPGSLEGMIAVGGDSYISEVMTVAGGRNILADSPVAYPKVLHEEIIARDPHVIVDMGEHADARALPPDLVRHERALWSRLSTVRAVRDNRVHIVSSSVYVVPGPRVVECARQFARFLHPEVFR